LYSHTFEKSDGACDITRPNGTLITASTRASGKRLQTLELAKESRYQQRKRGKGDTMSGVSNIVLVGFMGTGKTTIGRAVAQRCGSRFVDMDDVIVERAGKAIPEIFRDDGEAGFRKIERKVAHDLANESGLVIATGGGVVLDPDNMADFTRTGTVICLSATPEAILARVQHDTNRPLLQEEDVLGKINALLEKRRALYDAIPNQIDTTLLTTEEVTDRILALLSETAGA